MNEYKINLESVKEENEFILRIKYFGNSEKDYSFCFNNALKSIEGRYLKIEDSDGRIIEPDFKGHINPKNRDDINVMISDTKPFIYNSIAEIEEIDEKTVFLNFITAAYILKKGEPYYMYLHYLDEVTDKIEIVF